MTKSHRIKTMFFAASLRGGGAERVTVHLLTYLDRNRFDPTLVLVQPEGEFLHSVPTDVEVISLNRPRVRYAVPDLIRLLRARKPDVLVSIMRHANATAVVAKLLARSPARIVLTEHSFLSRSVSAESKSVLRMLISRLLYPSSDRVVTVSHGVAADLVSTLSLSPGKTVTIYNPVVGDSLQALMREEVSHPWFSSDRAAPVILGCGRLTTEKGFRYLVEALSLIRGDTDARLAIIGKGPQRSALKALVDDLELSNRVELLGFQPNPYKFMARADLFVLSSLWEGLGLVLIESMACGTPVISTDCPSGPGEVITDGVDGLLVPPRDPEALSDAIVRVLEDRHLADQLRRNGQRRAQDFTVDRSVRQYEELFVQLVEGDGVRR